MKKYFFALMALSLVFAAAGCGKKAQAPKQAAEMTSDSLSITNADSVLAVQPATEAQPQAQAPAANIVVNQEALPLVETPATSPASSSTQPPDAKSIQQALKQLGFYTGVVDGKLGPKTKEAIKEFQQRNNLEVDGKVGPKTWALLKSAAEKK